MAEETVESLELVISAKATDAARTVEALATSVESFGEQISKYLGGMTGFADALERISRAAQNLSGVKNLTSIIGKAAEAAKGAKARTVGKAFQPIVPPTRFAGTVKGATRNVRDASGRTFRYEQSSDALGKSLNQKYNTGFSNARLSRDIQDIRNQMLAGATESAMQEIERLSTTISSEGKLKSDGGLIEAFNKYFGNGVIQLDKKDTQNVVGQFGSIKAANETLKKIGVSAMLEGSMLERAASLDAIWEGRSTASGDIDLRPGNDSADDLRAMMASMGMKGSSDLGDLIRELGHTGDRRHQAWLNEHYFGDQNMAQVDVMADLLKSILGSTPVDAGKVAEQTKAELRKAQEAAAEAKRISQEMDAAWKGQAQWNREQDQRYREQYTSRDVRQQMNLDWKSETAGAGTDRTAQEVREWMDMEDEKYRAYMGQLAEGVVQDRTIGPGKDLKSVVEDVTGVSRVIKDASESASVFQKAFDAESATGSVAQRYEQFRDSVIERQRQMQEEREFLNLRNALSNNTPAAITRMRERMGDEAFNKFTNNNIPALADRGVAAGLITPEQAQAMKDAAMSTQEIGNQARVTAEEFAKSNSQVDLLSMKLQGVGQALEAAINSDKQDPAKIARLTEQYNKLSAAVRDAGTASQEAGDNVSKFRRIMDTLGTTISKSHVGKLASQFWRIAKMRALRAVVKAIGSAFKEGIGNMYQWSKALNGVFAGAMDTIASKSMFAKNSIATAFAPALMALVPVINTVVGWIHTASNAIAQFFALLNGQTSWTRAKETVEEWGDATKKSAKGASKDMKDLLADWDELNIIQSETGNGGGSGSGKKTPNYANMFEEVNVFDKNLKSVINNVKKRFGSVMDLVKEIGAAILAWKVSTTFAGLLGGLAALLGTGLIIDLTFKVSQVMTDTYFDTGNVGWLVGDVLTTMLGATLAKSVLSKVLGGVAGKIAVPLTFAVSAVATISTMVGRTDVSVLSQEALSAAVTAGLKGGVAAGYLYHLTGYSLGASLGGGVGMAAVTFGVAVGLKAIAQVAEEGKITSEVLSADFLSASLVGAGLTLTEIALGGTAATALTLGGGAALLTFGALVAIEAVIAETNRNTLKWGNYTATQEEIEAFVQEEIFEGAAPTVKLSLANAKIEELGQSKEDLENQMSEVLGELEVVSIGLKSSAESDIKTKVADLVKKFNETGEDYQEALQLGVSIVPVKGEDGQDQSKEILKNSKERWTDLNGIMTGLANDLTSAFDTAYNDKLDEVTRNSAKASIEKISGMMQQVADAISSGQAKAKVTIEFNKQVANLTHESMDALLAEYAKQRDELIDELMKTRTDSAEGVLAQQYAYEKLAEYALRDAGGDITDDTYNEYKTKAEKAASDYKQLVENAEEDVTREADRVLNQTEGVQSIRKTLLEKNFADLNLDPNSLMSAADWNNAETPDFYGEMFREMIEGEDPDEAVAWVKEGMNNLLRSAVGVDNLETYKNYIDAGILSFGDFFSKELLDQMADVMEIPEEGPYREAWDNIINEIMGIGKEQLEEAGQVDAKVKIKPIYDVEKPEKVGEIDAGEADVTGARYDPATGGSSAGRTAWYTGTPNEQLTVDAQASGMATDENINNLTASTEQGMNSIEGVLTMMRTVMNNIENYARQTAAKDLTVVISPTSALGRTTGRANEQYEKVSGDFVS